MFRKKRNEVRQVTRYAILFTRYAILFVFAEMEQKAVAKICIQENKKVQISRSILIIIEIFNLNIDKIWLVNSEMK